MYRLLWNERLKDGKSGRVRTLISLFRTSWKYFLFSLFSTAIMYLQYGRLRHSCCQCWCGICTRAPSHQWLLLGTIPFVKMKMDLQGISVKREHRLLLPRMNHVSPHHTNRHSIHSRSFIPSYFFLLNFRSFYVYVHYS